MTKCSTAFLCRTNAPLVRCAFDLIRRSRGIKLKIVGRDVAGKLKEIINEIVQFRTNIRTSAFLSALDDWIVQLQTEYSDKDNMEAYLAECQDYYGCLQVIAQQCDVVKELFQVIDNYFIDSEAADDPDAIILCSGHRSKGLEWDRVFILRPDLMPHPSAELEADIKQEENIEYVMLTRARNEMYICHDGQPA